MHAAISSIPHQLKSKHSKRAFEYLFAPNANKEKVLGPNNSEEWVVGQPIQKNLFIILIYIYMEAMCENGRTGWFASIRRAGCRLCLGG
jgi:hypothetical protein